MCRRLIAVGTLLVALVLVAPGCGTEEETAVEAKPVDYLPSHYRDGLNAVDTSRGVADTINLRRTDAMGVLDD